MNVGMYYNNSDVRLEQQPVPIVGEGDVLIKVVASGVCGSDLMEWYRIKRAPLVLGHEVTGDIVEIGKNVLQWKKGDRVFATHHVPCDECIYCLSGHTTACVVLQEKNNFAPGGFAEFLRVTGRSVATGILKLPDSMSYETGTFIDLNPAPLGPAGDYHITAASPARGLGAGNFIPQIAALAIDFDKQPRPDDTYDAGADEYSTAPSVGDPGSPGPSGDLVVPASPSPVTPAAIFKELYS